MAASALLVTLAVPASGGTVAVDGDSAGLAAVVASDALPEPDASTSGDSLDQAALADLATMAEQEGITLDEAVERYAWHAPFSELVHSIRKAYPADFAGARIESDGNPWIAFRSDVPKSAREHIVAASDDVLGTRTRQIDVVENRGFSEAELDSRLVKAHYAAFDQKQLVANASSGYDSVTGEIIVEIEPVSTLDPAERDNLVATVMSADKLAFENVTLRVVDEVRGGDTGTVYIYGGSALTTCTSGFAASKNGTRGMTTAGHCSNTQSDGGIVLNHHISYEGEWGDFQWMWADTDGSGNSVWESDNFYAGPYEADNRDLLGQGFPTEGQRLCRNGKATGKRCDDVYQLNHCYWNRCHLTLMEHNYASGGDSGGPWFYSRLGYGIHSGNKWWGWHYRDSFSPLDYIDNAIGAYILTS